MSNAQSAAPTSRREQILKEAARLFAERGFHGVGVDEIGAAVGISGPGLYRHFAGKDAMLAELLVGISERLLEGGRMRVAEGGESPGAVLDALIEGHIDFALDDRPLITLHDRELDRLREADRKRVRQLQRQYVELWVEVVRRVHPLPSEDRPAPRCTPSSACSTPPRTSAVPAPSRAGRRWPNCCTGWRWGPSARWPGSPRAGSRRRGVDRGGCAGGVVRTGRGVARTARARGGCVASPTGSVHLWTALVTGR